MAAFGEGFGDDPAIASSRLKSTGIDYEAIRSKYAALQGAGGAAGMLPPEMLPGNFNPGPAAPAYPSPAAPACDPYTGAPVSTHSHATLADSKANNQEAQVRKNEKALDRLSKFTVCERCMGSGLYKVIYNHCEQTKNCVDCDGNGLFLRVAGGKLVPYDSGDPDHIVLAARTDAIAAGEIDPAAEAEGAAGENPAVDGVAAGVAAASITEGDAAAAGSTASAAAAVAVTSSEPPPSYSWLVDDEDAPPPPT